MFRIFEDAVAKPILGLQDNIPDDISSEVTIKDLGLLVRAPVAAVVLITYILSAGVWLFMTKVPFCYLVFHDTHYISALVDKEIPLQSVGLGGTLPEPNCYAVLARPRSGG